MGVSDRSAACEAPLPAAPPAVHNVCVPQVAMVMAAGLGTRMRAHDGRIPKPLVTVGGKALIDHVLDKLAATGVARAVVNVHHMADQIERHLSGRSQPRIIISDERTALLGTAGGPLKAMEMLAPGPSTSSIPTPSGSTARATTSCGSPRPSTPRARMHCC
jgi:hypothetical protein